MKKKRIGTVVFFSVLALTLCGSVYLNWYFGGTKASGKTLGEAKYVNASSIVPEGNESYFINARIDRKNAYDTAVAELNAIISGNADSESKASATEKLTALALSNGEQVKIEQLVIAKGFGDCIAFVGDEGTSVIIDAETLDAAAAATVKDIVIRTTGQQPSEIQIVTIKEK